MAKRKVRNAILKCSFVIAFFTALISLLAIEAYMSGAVIVFTISAAYLALFISANLGRWKGVL